MNKEGKELATKILNLKRERKKLSYSFTTINAQRYRLVTSTEMGLIDLPKRELPGKEYMPAYAEAVCNSMKLNTLEKIYLVLKNEKPAVAVPKPIVKRARKAVEKMTEIVGRLNISKYMSITCSQNK